MNKEKIKLIIGLGNPEKQYQHTYHNVGIMAAEYISQKISDSKIKVIISDVNMNLSGSFVYKTTKKASVKPEDLLIIHDDSDIELGNYKLSFNRSSAGHKGIDSIIKSLKNKNFWRLRIGIRKTRKGIFGKKRQKAEEFVLKKIGRADKETLQKVIEDALSKIQQKLV